VPEKIHFMTLAPSKLLGEETFWERSLKNYQNFLSNVTFPFPGLVETKVEKNLMKAD
jgi:hypothetical protein